MNSEASVPPTLPGTTTKLKAMAESLPNGERLPLSAEDDFLVGQSFAFHRMN